MLEVIDYGPGREEHEHGPDDNDHSHELPPVLAFSPQPVPMGIAAELAVMEDGTDRVMVTFTSVNGSWTVFYDRQGAINHAQTLLTLAHLPPAPAVVPALDEPEAQPTP